MPILSMVNSGKSSDKLTVTIGAKKIFQAVYWDQSRAKGDEDIPRLRVSDMISKMAFYYEKVRNAVDYREESLLRKEAISRILKRQVVIEGALSGSATLDPVRIARTLLIELIRAGYLPNNQLPEDKGNEVAVILHKYLILRSTVLDRLNNGSQSINFNVAHKKEDLDDKGELNGWIIGLASAEIEENLSSSEATDTTVAVMYEMLARVVKLPVDLPYERDLAVQIYLAIYRNYLKLNDYHILSFVLFKYFNEDWSKPTDETIIRIADRLDELKTAIELQINHPLTAQLNRVVHQYTVYFTILKDVVEKDPKKAYEELNRDPAAFMRQIKNGIESRCAQAKKKLWANALRSIIYIFLTKSVLVVIMEVPLIKFFHEPVNYVALGINIAFPAFILFVSVALTRLPGDNNTKKVMAGVEEIVFAEKIRKQPVLLKGAENRGRVISAIFNFLYAATFFLTFGFVIWFLSKLYFSWVSTIIFIFFLAFVSFFVIRVRRGPRYWVVVEAKENILTFLWSFISVPVVSTGKWLSGKFQRLNFIAFFLDFIIEAPFKVLVAVAEEWTKYLKERRDSIS
jgi:hypothetical protein